MDPFDIFFIDASCQPSVFFSEAPFPVVTTRYSPFPPRRRSPSSSPTTPPISPDISLWLDSPALFLPFCFCRLLSLAHPFRVCACSYFPEFQSHSFFSISQFPAPSIYIFIHSTSISRTGPFPGPELYWSTQTSHPIPTEHNIPSNKILNYHPSTKSYFVQIFAKFRRRTPSHFKNYNLTCPYILINKEIVYI